MILLTLTKLPTSLTFAAVSTTEGAFLRYGALLELLEAHDGKAPWFQEQKKKLLGGTNARPSVIMRRFRNLVSWYDLRHNGMVYPFINGLLLWDIHCTRALEHWKRDAGKDLARWFEIIGEYEALSSLAGLHADDPAATMPTISSTESGEIKGTRIGHPLLAADKRVENDLEKFSTGQGLLITGSNMSGKSTFLRTLGVNAVLAFTGGPVTAESFSIPLCQLGTSIRISDSLKSGVSHFYAEVQKLAQVVEMTEGEHPVLFLLDEVLHGTNSRERQIGARWVLGELLKKGAFGIITTHDMELCRLPEHLMSHVRQHHFRENVKEGEMSFDYTLREGPVTSGNALRLMQRVGLNVPLEDNEN
jgi:DNA mismatch repair ATPase MutS